MMRVPVRTLVVRAGIEPAASGVSSQRSSKTELPDRGADDGSRTRCVSLTRRVQVHTCPIGMPSFAKRARAGDGSRTRYLSLTRRAHLHRCLSGAADAHHQHPIRDRMKWCAWSGGRESNPQPSGWKPGALPVELPPQARRRPRRTTWGTPAWRPSGARQVWSGRRESNPRHPRWQRGALPLSYVHVVGRDGASTMVRPRWCLRGPVSATTATVVLEARAGIEPACADLQSATWPLGHPAKDLVDGAARHCEDVL